MIVVGSAFGYLWWQGQIQRLSVYVGETREELRKFPHLVPEFVTEVLSPSDRLRSAQKKMRQWAANGVDLGWLIDGDRRTVYVYAGGGEPRTVENADRLEGEGSVTGFVMDLNVIWAGLG